MPKKKNIQTRIPKTKSRYYTGGFEPLSVLFKVAIQQYLNGVKKWGNRVFSDRKTQKEQIADLERRIKEKQQTTPPEPQGGKRICRRKRNRRLTGGKFDPRRDIVDFLAGPLGWAAMGVRKKRERKIAELQKQLNS